ncbi:MAG: CHASE2 domain-containing protein [Solirubrobacteraceae bacterium]
MAVAAFVALAGGLGAYLADAWPRLENDTIDMRFGIRSPSRPSEIVVVGIDDKTFSDLHRQWPFPRRLHGAVIDRLAADGARAIAYDVQFTEPTDSRDDLALYGSIARSRTPVVLATTEVNAAGKTNVLGGEDALRQAHAVAAAANLPAESGGVIRRYPYSLLGLESFAVATSQAAGPGISRSRFSDDRALIDFRGPPATIRTVSYADVLDGRVKPQVFRGKIVVVGATSATLQDVHQTSTTSASPMAGPEIQANAIWTALHDNPLQPSPGWLTLIAIVLGALIAPLACLRFRVLTSLLIAGLAAIAYLVAAQVAFDSGAVLVLSYPLAAWALAGIGTVAANYVGAFIERNVFAQRLRESQLELIQRLAQAVDTRDTETGEHIEHIGRLSQLLALQIGWSKEDAEVLRHASAMHDIGKIGIPDRILLKPGKPSPEEWDVIKAHTTAGAEILADSSNPLVQMAREIAMSHHERWDGSGYPAGLKGEEIPIAARICAVVDVYDALLAKRPYKEAWSTEQALAEIQQGSGTHFDPELVQAFLLLAPQLDGDLGGSAEGRVRGEPRASLASDSLPSTGVRPISRSR